MYTYEYVKWMKAMTQNTLKESIRNTLLFWDAYTTCEGILF